jgi:signal transduction histidine kinase
MDDMRATFNASLSQAADRQRTADASIDRSLWTGRVMVMLFTLFGATALGLYVRHLRLYDTERADRQRDLEDQVRSRTAELRQLAGYLLTAREDEKAHLARELHDELGGLLTAAKLNMARMRRAVATDAVMLERIGQVSACLDEGIALKRRIVEELRPSGLDLLGLNVALSNLCADTEARLGIPIGVDFDQVSLDGDAQLALYRLVQEALTNIGRYANASQVRVHMKLEPGCVRVGIEDDGIGFDVTQLKSSTHGIAGMRFRIERLDGTLIVDSTPTVGTRLAAMLPIR